MTDPEKPELEAVAWRAIPPHPADPKNSIMLYPGSEREEARVRYASGGWDVEPLTPLPAAQALLAQRDERIKELEAACGWSELQEVRISELETKLASVDTERIVSQEECETLRARLARWRAIVRAALSFVDSLDSLDGDALEIYSLDTRLALDELSSWIDALSEQERSEILQGGS